MGFNLTEQLINLQNFLIKKLCIKIIQVKGLSLIKKHIHHLLICRNNCQVCVRQIFEFTAISKTCHLISPYTFNDHDRLWFFRILSKCLVNYVGKMIKGVKPELYISSTVSNWPYIFISIIMLIFTDLLVKSSLIIM